MSNGRSETIVRCGWLFILTNVLLAGLNVVIGIMSNSLAIASDAVHSLIDSISGILVVVGEKIARHKKFAPNREKIERVTTIIIASIIIVTGIEIMILSIKNILDPEEVNYSLPVMIVLIISLLTKLGLAMFLKKTGRSIKSKVVEASGAETMNDYLISVAVLVSAIIYLIWQIDVESYVSIVIAFIIVKIGLEFIFPHALHHHHHHLDHNHDHGLKA